MYMGKSHVYSITDSMQECFTLYASQLDYIFLLLLVYMYGITLGKNEMGKKREEAKGENGRKKDFTWSW